MFFLTKLAVAKRSVTILVALALFGGGVASWARMFGALSAVVRLYTPDPEAGDGGGGAVQ